MVDTHRGYPSWALIADTCRGYPRGVPRQLFSPLEASDGDFLHLRGGKLPRERAEVTNSTTNTPISGTQEHAKRSWMPT